MTNLTFSLVDGVKLHEARPKTFFVPSDEVKANIEVGDRVRLIFDHEEVDLPQEQLWVTVTKAKNPKFVGTLNDWSLFKPALKMGLEIDFRAENIVYVVKD
ncbi:hypothetical protein QEH42_gp302 [Microbacterium phage Pumpernickel]|uniref:DUF2314 domain-containing protein n=1 Tax=Microbacterium phage Pumpernickel TaxID=2885983 RepID=A0AAE9C2W8_9CAUD|nr:hypothetical protein QEH42_gp302 [Microbacterium phage Pumpernickel]UDL15916.1 hypothetical protein SEA_PUMPERNICKEL_150 [Microbacterium phage Pumpernickel]